MSVWNDKNDIPDKVVSPSNYKIIYLEDEDAIYNGTLTDQIILLDYKTGKLYMENNPFGRQVTKSIKQLLADSKIRAVGSFNAPAVAPVTAPATKP